VSNLDKLVKEGSPAIFTDLRVEQDHTLAADISSSAALDLQISTDDVEGFSLRFFSESGDCLCLTVDFSSLKIALDRQQFSVSMDSNPEFSDIIYAALEPSSQGEFGIRVLLDSSSIEVFDARGVGLLSCLFFSDSAVTDAVISPLGSNKSLMLQKVQVSFLHGIW
jgi:sucrose-6-phosphate hydrolase SacC (GH32 family)